MLSENKQPQLDRYYLAGDDPALLADVYQDHVQLINCQRHLSKLVKYDIKNLLANRSSFAFRIILTPDQVAIWLQQQFGENNYDHLAQDIEILATLFSDLFGTAEIGLRLELIDKTLCPVFHVDKVSCRLVTTYFGHTTEWLENTNTNRQALHNHQYEHVVIDQNKITHVSVGDVLLFKGLNWSDDRNEGVIHRSPQASPEQRRLLLTLDII